MDSIPQNHMSPQIETARSMRSPPNQHAEIQTEHRSFLKLAHPFVDLLHLRIITVAVVDLILLFVPPNPAFLGGSRFLVRYELSNYSNSSFVEFVDYPYE